jgi:hypothetical protein
MTLRNLAASLLLAVPLVAGCRTDESPSAPDLSNNGGLLARYVAMGNSITAGFQSAGINDSTQRRSYAAVFARQARAPYFYAALNMPGCPAPFTNNVTQTRVDNQPPTSPCALRRQDQVPFLSNVAVPGAHAIDAFTNTDPASGPNALTTVILGGRSQVEAMADAQPTFVSVWLGNNDVLGALTSTANPGNPALVTSEPAFESAYTAVLDSVAATGAKAALFAVADVTVIPYSSSGSTYWCLKNGVCPGVPSGGFPAVFTVNNNCAPGAAVPGAKGDSILVPWTVGVPKLSAALAGVPQTLDCSVDAQVVTPFEYKTMREAVAGYNAFIAAQAAQRNWAFVDVNPALLAARADQPVTVPPPPAAQQTFPKIALFPCFPGKPCGSKVNPGPAVLFGTYFSLDGVHPSEVAQRVIADSLISAVNRTYGTGIPFAGP